MADFVLGRLKFTFKGVWTPSTAYLTDDIVRYGGQSYVALSNHTSSPGDGFYTDNTAGRWSLISAGTDWKGDWQVNTYYKINDVVKYGGVIYVCNVGHLSNVTTGYGLEADYDKWVTYSATPNFVGDWAANTRYRLSDLVQYGGSLHLITTPHFSNANSSSNVATWTTHEANTTIFVQGLEFEDTYAAGTEYQVGDIVRYGGYNFIAIEDTIGNLPTNTTYWRVLSTGFKHRGDYNNGTSYEPGDVVRYGASTYVAFADTTGNLPTNQTYWNLLSRGQMWRGDYVANVAYKPGDLVKYGGYLYVANVDSTGNAPSNNTYWDLQMTGFNWKGLWASNVTYQLGDTVNYTNSSYISIVTDNANIIPGDSGSETSWNLIASGSAEDVTTNIGDMLYKSAGGITRLGIGAEGQILTVAAGIPSWEDNSFTGNVYYVAPEGVDNAGAGYGQSLQRPFASIKYAAIEAGANATIFVKSGTYYEQLPITVQSNTAIVGDNLRTVTILPKAGLSDDGINQNNTATMFYLSDGSILNKMSFKGMTGWTANVVDQDNLASTIPAGVFTALNPLTPITHKSPYVIECSAISDGGIGALVDGTVHASGNKSMIFHGYTIISSDGIGYWIKDGGRAELVSCFTYYCKFGYATTGGGVIRSLNGNNSYGRIGAYSEGSLLTEAPLIGNVYGEQLEIVYEGGDFSVGSFITGQTSGANATVTSNQTTGNKLYIKTNSGTFLNGETITSSFGANAVISSNTAGQEGFIVVADGFSSEPVPGSSIEFSDDNQYAYVIQSVSGTYTNTSSLVTIVLTQDKPNRSQDNATITIKRNYSQTRLTGHDFLNIGTGNVYTTNYPNTASQPVTQGNEVVEDFPGRVFYVSTDQEGNFRVGDYFRIDQATGTATLNASAFNLAGLTSLRLGSIGAQLGETINEFSADATLGGNSNLAVPTEYAVKTFVTTKLSDFQTPMHEPTGFNRSDANTVGVIEFTHNGTDIYILDQNDQGSTRSDGLFATGTIWQRAATPKTLIIRPVAGQTSFTYWQDGIKYSVTDPISATYTNFDGTNHYYLDQGNLIRTASITGDIIQKYPYVVMTYGNESTGNVVVFGNERHGITMDGATHIYLHTTTGTRYRSGLGVAGVSANANVYTSTASGLMWDEDILITVPTMTGGNPFLYLDGSLWKQTSPSLSYTYAPSGNVKYNEQVSPGSYALTDIPEGEYAVMYFIATNDCLYPTKKVIGQRTFTSLAAARESAQTEPRDTSLLGLPAAEFLYIGAVVVNHLGEVQVLDNNAVYVDLRLVNVSAGTNSSSALQSIAADTYFNNSLSQLAATNVQDAIDELATSSGGDPAIALLTIPYNSANVTYDSEGRPNAYIIGNYSVSNIQYSTVPSPIEIFPGLSFSAVANIFSNVIVSYTETLGDLTQNVTINYSANSNTITSIVIS